MAHIDIDDYVETQAHFQFYILKFIFLFLRSLFFTGKQTSINVGKNSKIMKYNYFLFNLTLVTFFVLSFSSSTLIKAAEAEAVETDPHSKCPVAGACPYYEKVKETYKLKKGSGCPLTEKCPYYQQHKNDKNKESAMVEKNHRCPLAEKCTYYQAIKRGEKPEIDFSKSGCPLAGKCPYYDQVKENKGKLTDCPVMHGCPKYMKEHGKPGAHVMSGDSSKCPYLQGKYNGEAGEKKEGCPALVKCPYYNKKDGEEPKGCPLKSKCPYYDQVKEGKVDFDLSEYEGKPCPLAKKCPYYKKFVSGEYKGCPAQEGCPYFSKESKSKSGHHGDPAECPYLKKMKGGNSDESGEDDAEEGCPFMKAKAAAALAAKEDEAQDDAEPSPTDGNHDEL